MTETPETTATGAPEKPPKTAKTPPKKDKEKPLTGVQMVKLKDIVLPDDWNREKLTKISELAASIKDIGLANALTVLPDNEHPGKYLLRDGRRRYAALQEAKITEAPVNVLGEMTPERARLLSIAANENREDNNPYEKALAFERAAADGSTNQEIAKLCGKTAGYVSQHRSILRTPDKVQKAIRDGKLAPSATRILLKMNYEEDQEFYDKVAEMLIDGSISMEDAAEKVDFYLTKKEEKEKGSGKKKKSAAKTKAEKKRGPSVRVPDYADKDVLKMMSPITKTDANQWLQHYAEKLAKTISKVKSAYHQGVLHGIEISYGLRGE